MSDLTTTDRFKAWLVSGPLARGSAFALEFSAALRHWLVERRSD